MAYPVTSIIVNFDAPHCDSCLSATLYARGLCRSCYDRHRRRGSFAGAPRLRVPVSVVADEFRHLQSAGVCRRDMPARLGMTRSAFDRALLRAGVAG